ncbi:MAG TPA: S8 family peptidase, partial [Blastocatellia bacterium]|nr:S8 family peptidase [Blastocatellia bacterium]
MKRLRLAVRILLIAAIILPAFAGFNFECLLETSAHAQSESGTANRNNPNRKISTDLADEMRASPNKRVSVIIQTSSTPHIGLLTAINQSGGKVNRIFQGIDAVSLELPARAVVALSMRDEVRYISSDRPARVAGHLDSTTGTDLTQFYGTNSIGAIDGRGIGIAVLDSGIHSSHQSLKNAWGQSRVVASVDFTGEGRTDDPFGHGTHVASIAAGNGDISFGAYRGIAPAANIVNVRVLNSTGQGSTSSVLAGIDWCIANRSAYNIKVMNLSLGTTAVDSYRYDPLCLAVRRAFDAGIVVCVAAGNTGKDEAGQKMYGAVHSPGIEPSAITVGAANTFGTDYRSDDGVATYSSRGPTRGHYTDDAGVRRYDNIIKPDLIAQGNKIIGAKSPSNLLVTENPSLDASFTTNVNRGLMRMSGTSVATPVVSGAAALLLQRNSSLNPNLVKAVLEFTSQTLSGYNTLEQGAGLLNVEGAVRLAGHVRTDHAQLSLGSPLLSGNPPYHYSFIA